jgi:Protein of unknown function (DUF998)
MQAANSDADKKVTRALLACGIVAGPLYVVLGLIQAFTREGFDIRRHPLSLLSNGDLGWIQISTFVVSGLLVVMYAIGIRRALHPGRGATWGPLLVGTYGVGLIAAGIFVADPALGFPPGATAGAPGTISSHGLLHFVAGGVGFLSLIAGCFALARRFAALNQWGWAAFSVTTGAVFFAAFFGIASGSGKVWINLTFGAAVVLVWVWIAATAARFRKEVS